MLKFLIRIESINLIGLIGSAITIIGLIIIIVRKFIIEPYKKNQDKINTIKMLRAIYTKSEIFIGNTFWEY